MTVQASDPLAEVEDVLGGSGGERKCGCAGAREKKKIQHTKGTGLGAEAEAEG